MTAAAHRCVVCGANGGRSHAVREMMFGTRQPFPYWECLSCACCQLLEIPDLQPHYPATYHAYQIQPRPAGLRGLLRALRDRGVFRGLPSGMLLNRLAPYPVFGAHRWFQRMQVRPSASILDVGCGTGELVRDLRAAGFSGAQGIDPFLPTEVLRQLQGLVTPIGLPEVQGSYDVVMLHHVLEHIPDQRATMREIARVLAPGGWCLIRIPKLPNAAWTKYAEHWVQLDAPRHVIIHSERSLGLLAGEAGLRIVAAEDDSTEFQFTGSELYERDIPLDRLHHSWSRGQVRAFRREALRLNRAGRGDQAAYYLRRATA